MSLEESPQYGDLETVLTDFLTSHADEGWERVESKIFALPNLDLGANSPPGTIFEPVQQIVLAKKRTTSELLTIPTIWSKSNRLNANNLQIQTVQRIRELLAWQQKWEEMTWEEGAPQRTDLASRETTRLVAEYMDPRKFYGTTVDGK